MRKIKPAFKLWLERDEDYVFGQGTFDLLLKIQEVGTLSGAAQELGMSYRHAWGLVKKVEERMGEPVLKTYKGGGFGGGGAELTQAGRFLLKEYLKVKGVFSSIYVDELSWEELFMKISARNRVEGEVVSVEKGDVAATVKIRIAVPSVITALITKEAVEDLKIKKGDKVKAVIKATEVLISKET